MAVGAHKITEEFEKELCRYTGAPYAVAIDNASNALFLALYHERNIRGVKSEYVIVPPNTYPSVPCEAIHAGYKVVFDNISHSNIYPKKTEFLENTKSQYITGAYDLCPTKVWDSALRFTHNMYIPDTHMCLSFTGPYKHLKLGKGGAILTDDKQAYEWFKKARFSGRHECSYHVDDFDKNPVIGWNFYMMPEIAARGLLLMAQFYDAEGNPLKNRDLRLAYPDLSKFKIYNQ